MSTGLDAAPTHWRHTVLWLEESRRARACAGDEVEGTVGYARIAGSPRDYRIELLWRWRRRSGGAVEEAKDSFTQTFMLKA